jgi:hypothetical protein
MSTIFSDAPIGLAMKNWLRRHVALTLFLDGFDGIARVDPLIVV